MICWQGTSTREVKKRRPGDTTRKTCAAEFLSILISRFVVEKKTQVSQVLMDGVYSEKSPLFLLRGQIWEQVVLPRIMTELEFYWRKLAKQGRTPEEAARYHMKRNGEPHHSIVNLLPPPPPTDSKLLYHNIVTGLWVTLNWQIW